jgi:hypothetical protein
MCLPGKSSLGALLSKTLDFGVRPVLLKRIVLQLVFTSQGNAGSHAVLISRKNLENPIYFSMPG